MYLVNPGNIVQALDARTGELIWENRVGPEPARRLRRDAQPRDLSGQGLRRDHRRAAGRARRAHRQASSGRRRIADRRKGYGNTSGPIVINGKVIQGLRRLRALQGRRLLHQRLRRRNRQAALEVQHRRARRAAGRRHLGQAAEPVCAPAATPGSPAATIPSSNLTYWGVAQAKPWMPREPRHDGRDKALYTSSTLALNADDGKLAWYFQHVPGESLDLDEVFERVLVDVGGQKLVFTIGKAGILWKLDRKTGKFLGHKETVFQNVFDRIDPKTGDADVSHRHRRAADRRVGARRARAPKAATTGRR